jgi:hypothetical protein
LSFTSSTPQWSPIIDRDSDLKPFLQYPREKTDQDEVLDLLASSASDWINSYLGRPIAPTKFTERFDGWAGWTGSIILLPYYPVLEVVSVLEYWGLSGPHSLVEQTPANQYGVGYTAGSPSQGTYQLNPRIGEIRRTFPGLVQKPFFPGSRNIEITWVAGFDPIPGQVKFAALELASHWYRSSQEQEEIHYGPGGGGGSGRDDLWPAVPNRVTMLLESFTQQGIG